ncbi:CMRF35-like molecule 7 [Apteryx rowi]|uniref:CMRF35-like molecule 7 n=1 Tax=Apteryx rowi TaxID=308060 RepID=UPI000E1E2694|nr:CMRF35-like molecule 7 [Apteryx rowi]
MLEGLLVWTWLLLPGCRALTGPAEASGPVGGTVSVSCAYKPELAEAEKYWCRGSGWFYCSILVQTAAAEDEASGDRVRLRDDRAQHVFVVTMENLTVGDGDTYWCGIQQPWYDLMVPVVVSVLPAPNVTDYPIYTTREEEPTSAASFPWDPPEPASTASMFNSSSPQAGAPNLPVLVLMPSVALALVLSIVIGLRMRRASPGKTSAARDAARTGDKDRQGPAGWRQAAAPPNICANTKQELGSPEDDYENSPAMCQDLEKRYEVFFSSAKSSAPNSQPIYINMRPAGPRSGPRCHKAQRAGEGIR